MMGGMGTSADAGDAPAGRGPTPYLPEPTGPCPVGTTSLWLTDTSRPDPWAAGVNARELMVSLWYPAAPSDGRRAQYMTPAESELQLTSRGITGIPPDALSTVRDQRGQRRQRRPGVSAACPSSCSRPASPTPAARSPPWPRTWPATATSWPGLTTPTRVRHGLSRRAGHHLPAPVRHPGGTGVQEKVAAGRAADVCFVLGELTGAHPAWPGAGLIDPSRMAMAGHSAGGAAAIAAMLADSRIRAGIDMDGSTAAPIPDEGLSRPFLFLGKQSNYTPGSGGAVTTPRDWKLLRGAVITWERDWELLTGWKRWLVVAGAVHASFTDLALLADQTGIDIGAGLSGARSLDITRAYVRAFFDQHLRGRPQALLDQPSPRYPEVTFCSP